MEECCNASDPLQLAGHLLRKWQRGFGQLVTAAQLASAQAQLNTVENLHHLAEAMAQSPAQSIRKVRARPAMLCCLSSGPLASVKLPRAPDLGGSLSATREGGAGEQGPAGAESPEEPILISEVGAIIFQQRLLGDKLINCGEHIRPASRAACRLERGFVMHACHRLR